MLNCQLSIVNCQFSTYFQNNLMTKRTYNYIFALSALLTFAIVVGEVTLASFLGVPAFGPYLFLLGQHRAYEPAALSFASFLLTWVAMGLIQLFTGGQGQTTGAH